MALAIDFARERFPAFPDPAPFPAAQLNQWLEALHVYPISAKEWQCTPRWTLGPRVVNDSMWFNIVSGRGWGRVGAEGTVAQFAIRPGDLMLIPQGAEHTVRQHRGHAFHLYAVHFHAQVFEGINLLDLLGFPAHLPASAGAPYLDASRRLAHEHALKAPGWRAAMAAEIQRVLFHILRTHGSRFRTLSSLPLAKGETPRGSASSLPLTKGEIQRGSASSLPLTKGEIQRGSQAFARLPRLLPSLEWIERNLHKPELNVRDLAAQLYVSEVQFRKIFQRVTGCSPVRFIQRRRVERASALLRGSEMSVAQIAEACGFNDAAFFCRVFRAWTKTSPRRYRESLEL